MAITTYNELKTALADWSKRTDLTSYMGDFIALGEARLNRDLRLRKMIANTTLTCVAGQPYVTLPTDWLESENVTITNTSPPKTLHVVTPEYMGQQYPDDYWTAAPEVYAVVGDKLLLGPTPDAAYTITLDYYKRLDLATDTTNWLLQKNPGIYLSAAMAELCMYTFDDRFSLWDAKCLGEMKALQDADDGALRSGSAMRVRRI